MLYHSAFQAPKDVYCHIISFKKSECIISERINYFYLAPICLWHRFLWPMYVHNLQWQIRSINIEFQYISIQGDTRIVKCYWKLDITVGIQTKHCFYSIHMVNRFNLERFKSFKPIGSGGIKLTKMCIDHIKINWKCALAPYLSSTLITTLIMTGIELRHKEARGR